jgi:hypothetical protein
MLCSDPFVKAREAFPCGKCLPCRNRMRNIWTHRIILESQLHSDSAFVTLTYADDTMPADMSLQPAHLRDFLKRLRSHTDYHTRKQLSSLKLGKAVIEDEVVKRRIRFFACGEYGDESARPHYHAVLFGFKTCLRGGSVYFAGSTKCCSQCDLIRGLWGFGNVWLGNLTGASAAYTVGYIVKNMMHRHDPRLKGREPEFSRKSLKPGLGFGALSEVTETYLKYGLDFGEAPTRLVHGGKPKPLGRYLRTKLAEMLGMERSSLDEEMLALWEAAKAATPQGGGEMRRLVFKNLLIDAGEQKVLNMAARQKMKRKGQL